MSSGESKYVLKSVSKSYIFNKALNNVQKLICLKIQLKKQTNKNIFIEHKP